MKTHVGSIFGKLGVRDRAAAIVFAYDHGVVRPEPSSGRPPLGSATGPVGRCRAAPRAATVGDMPTMALKASGDTMRTGRLAASAAHPWRVLGAWTAVGVLAVVVIVTFLGGNLTTEGRRRTTRNPSARGRSAAFRRTRDGRHGRRRHPLRGLRGRFAAVQGLRPRVRLRQRDHGSRPCSNVPRRQRRGARVGGSARDDDPVALLDDDETEALVEKVEAARKARAFALSVTGDETVDHDFNLLAGGPGERRAQVRAARRARDPAARVRRGRRRARPPLLMAIVAIVVALGLTALLARQFELSVFVINMLTGMGLALGIDYSLFVVSVPGGACQGSTNSMRSKRREQPRVARCSSAAASSSWRCSGCCSSRTRSCAASRSERSSSGSSRWSPR